MLTITISGAQAQRAATLKAVKDAGFRPVTNEADDPIDHDWGHDRGKHEVFLTVEGEDVDRVVEVLPANWRLRSHRNTPERSPVPTVEERLAAVGLSVGDLRTALGV